MSERVKSQSEGPETAGVFESDTEHGYLEGYEGREFADGPERAAESSTAGDWGRQGEWGAFSNRPSRRRNQNWPAMGGLGSYAGKPDDPPKKP